MIDMKIGKANKLVLILVYTKYKVAMILCHPIKALIIFDFLANNSHI